ncbi:hypothetical protein [Bordetella sp. LUAb4]|uniref:hypothetical protein n=1 Tax=Bordetella sp. LUAb4 TaxID=2843195 RepID=UPI001E5281F4|nr:hypothetical protein [Bordetella sp. LUAb4]
MNGSAAHRARLDGSLIQTIVRLEEYHAIFTEPEQCDRLDSLLRVISEKMWNGADREVSSDTKTSFFIERKMKA